METITKLQEELFNSYNNGEVSEPELTNKVKHLKTDMVMMVTKNVCRI